MSTTVAVHEIHTENPATGAPLRTYRAHSPQEIDQTLDRVHAGFARHPFDALAERGQALHRVAAALRERKASLAAVITAEMGKPITESEAEIEKCAWTCDYYADHASSSLADEIVESNAARSFIAFRPLGVVLAIMPWNFPFWQLFRAAAPALMAGNAMVLKHAINVTECALEIERLFAACGFEDVFATILVASREMDTIVADPRIAAVTLTGSEGAGSAVAAVAGKHIKKTVLELGGSDAFIVLADADLDEAATVAVRSRFQNTGQSCIAAKRFIVEEPVYDRFVSAFVEKTKQLVAGDPRERTTQIGPLARADLRDSLERQVAASLAAGAKAALGAHRLDRPGHYYAPTIVVEVEPGMPMFDQETFGPAAAVIRARDTDHAVELANRSNFGLGGNLWTRDLERAQRLAERLESGAVFINGMTASDARLPFGGVKHSGYGRELSYVGIREFVNIQTVWIGPAK
ncbi:MAG TPA: NAD-dependent succinate-semialdehyde dehydrogenase [Candidatus Acidoferrales bacterium]|nr:NAD-dependent succinate-semialdehyde dehydrogenase [Candidatus Acidoferrales bacterium]